MSERIEIAKSLLSPPGDTIQETIDALGMSQAELAERTGRPKEKLNDIIKGREPISTATAFLLEKVLGIPSSFWINREKEYRRQLYELEQEAKVEEYFEWLDLFPVKQMCKMGWLAWSKEKHDMVGQLLKFFSMASPEEWFRIYFRQEVAVSFRISLSNTKSPYAISAWLRQGEIQSKKITIKEYNKISFKASLMEIKEIAYQMPEDFADRLQKICAENGVAVVYTPNLPRAPISGAVRWFRNKPLIQLSGRYKTDDHFWFSFFHEAAHIILHGKKDIFLEDVEGTETDQKKETEANLFASKLLLKDSEYQIIKEDLPISEAEILIYSKRFRTPAGTIIGRLQHEKLIPFSFGNHLRENIDLFDI